MEEEEKGRSCSALLRDTSTGRVFPLDPIPSNSHHNRVASYPESIENKDIVELLVRMECLKEMSNTLLSSLIEEEEKAGKGEKGEQMADGDDEEEDDENGEVEKEESLPQPPKQKKMRLE